MGGKDVDARRLYPEREREREGGKRKQRMRRRLGKTLQHSPAGIKPKGHRALLWPLDARCGGVREAPLAVRVPPAPVSVVLPGLAHPFEGEWGCSEHGV